MNEYIVLMHGILLGIQFMLALWVFDVLMDIRNTKSTDRERPVTTQESEE